MKQVLSGRRSSDRTIGIHEDLSWGPIGEARIGDRIAFMNREAPTPWPEYWESLPEKDAEFWGAIEAWPGDRLIWLGSCSAPERAAYLAYLDRFPDRRAAVVRPDDHLPPHPRLGVAGATGVLNAEQMGEVLDHAERRPICEDAHLFGRWQQLVEEGALLRVIDGDALKSAPIDAYDHFLLDSLSADWTWAVRVVAHAMGRSLDAKVWVSDDIFFSRLASLVASGSVEADGDVLAWNEDFRRTKAHVRLAVR